MGLLSQPAQGLSSCFIAIEVVDARRDGYLSHVATSETHHRWEGPRVDVHPHRHAPEGEAQATEYVVHLGLYF